jgi:outer membrane protein TolC
MHRIWKALGFIGVVAAWTAHGQPLSLPDAQRLALARSQQLAAQDSAALASREMAIAAGQLPDPVLKLGVDNLPVNGAERFSLTRDFMTMRRIGVTQELVRREKRDLRALRLEREAEKSLVEKDAAVAAIERETALAWLERHYAEALAAVLAEQLAHARLEVQAAEAAYRGARAGQSDVITAHGTVAALEDRASEIDRRIAVAKSNLVRWVGDSAERRLAAAPPMESIPLEAGALEAHLSGHPEIVALLRQEEIAATEARIAQASRRPDWTVEVAYQQRGPDFSNMVSLGVSVPLPWDRGNRQDREAASKLAMAQQARAQREELLRAHAGEVRAMIVEWHNGRERLVRYRRDLLPLARERAQAALAAYQGGRTSVAELLGARRNEAEVRMQAVQLETEIARLWARLNFLLPDHTLHQEVRK